MVKRKSNLEQEVSLVDIRTSVRKEIVKKYGSVAKFLHSSDSEKFGGKKVRTYLYDTGPVNYQVIADLAKWLGFGELKRRIIVTRTYKYSIIKDTEVSKN